jgi:hypothetical protein
MVVYATLYTKVIISLSKPKTENSNYLRSNFYVQAAAQYFVFVWARVGALFLDE